MATRNVGAKFTISGEKEYKQALSEINAGLKVLDSEMKLVSAQFLDNSDSVDALTAKQDVLNRKISSQKEKIETLKSALQSSAVAYGESDTRTMKWQTSLNNAEAELSKLNNQLDKNEQALQEAAEAARKTENAMDGAADAMAGTSTSSGKSGTAIDKLKEKFQSVSGESKGFGDVLGDVTNKLGINLPEGAQNTLNSLGTVNPAAVAAAGGFAALAAAIVKAEKALWDMTEASAASADEILTLSAQTGLSTTDLQEFAYASELLDVSLDTLQGSLTKLTNNMQTAANSGTGEAYEAFNQLGIAITNADGSLRSANDVFYETIDALGRVQNATERDALTMDIFGESAQDLNPLIIQGSDSLAQYAQEANDLGYVMDNDMLAALGAVDDAQQRLLKTQEAVSNQISAEYAPYMEEALGDTASFIEKIGDALTKSGVVDSFGSILTSVTELLDPLADLAGPVLSVLGEALKPIASLLALIADTANLIHGILTLDIDKIKTAMGLNISSGQMSNYQKIYYSDALKTQAYDASTGLYTGTYKGGYYEAGTGKFVPYNASGNYNFPGGLTYLNENGPEIVELPRGTRIYTNQESREMGGDVYNITIDAKSVKEFNDIVQIVQQQRRIERMEGK